MSDLIGIWSISLVFLITLLLALQLPRIAKILFVALVVRVFFLIINNYITPLPDSTADAETFEIIASRLSKDGFFNLLTYFKGPDAQFISWLIAIPYSILGRSIVMAQSISLLFGIGCVFLGWKLANLLWDEDTADKAAWVIALFPSLVLYSVLVMREVYVCFFLIVSLYGITCWIKTDKFIYIILAILGFVGATFFHGAMFIGAIIFIAYIGISSIKKLYNSLVNLRISLKILTYFSFFLICTTFYLNNKINVPYIDNFRNLTNWDTTLRKSNLAIRGEASYPEWSRANHPIELLYKGPARSIYFFFSPFPWDIRKISHIIGLFDAIIYMFLVYLILKNIKVIWNDPSLRIILILLLCYIFVFGVGVGNFGTGIRHRSKFAIMFILLAVPLIKKLVFFKKLGKE